MKFGARFSCDMHDGKTQHAPAEVGHRIIGEPNQTSWRCQGKLRRRLKKETRASFDTRYYCKWAELAKSRQQHRPVLDGPPWTTHNPCMHLLRAVVDPARLAFYGQAFMWCPDHFGS